MIDWGRNPFKECYVLDWELTCPQLQIDVSLNEVIMSVRLVVSEKSECI